MKLTKVKAGWYATEDGRFAVVADDYDVDDSDNKVHGREWAAVFDPAGGLRQAHNNGENLDWFEKKAEAVAYLQGHVDWVRSNSGEYFAL